MIQPLLHAIELTDSLREISQKRKQGILEISTESKCTNIYFVAGRIVDCDTSDEKSAISMINWLHKSNLIEIVNTPAAVNYQDVYDLVKPISQTLAEPEKFKFYIEQRLLQNLYQVEYTPNHSIHFSAKIVANVGQFNPKIPVGQFLLDLVTLSENQSTMEELSTLNPIIYLACPDESFHPINQIIINLLEIGPLAFNLLKQRSGLCDIQFFETFQSLLKNGQLSIEEVDISNDRREEIELHQAIIVQPATVHKVEQEREDAILIEQQENKMESQFTIPTVATTVSSLTAINHTVRLSQTKIKEENQYFSTLDMLQNNYIVEFSIYLFVLLAGLIVLVNWPFYFTPFNYY